MSQDDFTIDTAAEGAELRGVFRLESPEAYDRLFAPIRDALRAAKSYTLDLGEAVLMNSSGIRALGTLVLEAKKSGARLTIRGKSSVPWQKKTVASLQPLYRDGLTVLLA